MNIEFTKMEGCGNDYIYVDSVGHDFPDVDKSRLAIEISDRHFGVGSDGIIFINKSSIADFEMEMYNADGSRGRMCGNGMRCVSRFVYDKGYTDKEEFSVESMGSIKHVKVFSEDHVVKSVTVDMGEPILTPESIPVSITEDEFKASDRTEFKFLNGSVPAVRVPIKAGSLETKITCVSMGNPHGIIFFDDLPEELRDMKKLPLSEIGPLFENHRMFPDRVNTEFAEVIDRKNINMRVWERGSGETLACGTGCSATAVAGVLTGKTDREVTVHVIGGDLNIKWDEGDDHIYMTGPAKYVFTGTYDYKG